MLREIEIPQSEHGTPVRRWFQGELVEMVLWENKEGDIIKFRLASRGKHPEESLTWTSSSKNLNHQHFEEDSKHTDWVEDSVKASPELIASFKNESHTLPEVIRTFVFENINFI